MRLRFLGPLELMVGGRSIDVTGLRQRVILAMLGLNANRVTSLEDLIDAVWDTAPPPTARGQIQTCISALRKLITDAGHQEVIKTYPAGYLLTTSASSLDIEEFAGLTTAARDLADNGRLAAAAATLRSALGLWRGPALAGVDSRLVRRRAELLEHGKLLALEERVRLDLALGWHGEIIGELAALVDEYPLREKLSGFLMLALYRSGRQAEALEVYRRAHLTLVEELAIEPGPELRELERAILNGDPALDLRADPPVLAVEGRRREEPEPAGEQPMVPRLLPWRIADFTGREDLIAGIVGLVTDAHSTPIVVISGKGGVGKSSLAIRAAHDLIDLFPDGNLYAHFRCAAGGDRTAMLLARFLRALGVSGPSVPDDLQERADLYRTLLAGKRLLVVLDDVTSEEQVLPLLPGSPDCVVIVTSRVRLSGLPGARQIDVDVLDTGQSVELIAKIVGTDRVEAERAAAVELARLCGGLPLALRIAGARLASRPHWRISGLVRRLAVETRRLDEFTHRGLELRSNIGLTYRGLPHRAKLLFRLLAMQEALDFPSWTAAALLDTDLCEAQDLLESLVDAQMLDVVSYPGHRVWYRFHDLIRVYARELLADIDAPVRDAALRRVLGGWLALAEEAHRKEYGGDYTVLRGEAPRWRPPHHDDASFLFEDPVDLWDSQRNALVAAVRQAAAAGLDELCWNLALWSVTLFEVKGYFDYWRETSELGLRATTRTGNRLGQAAMHYSLGTLCMFQKRLAEAEGEFAAALVGFDAERSDHGRALVWRNLAVMCGLRGNGQAMMTKYGDALELMRAVGDRMGEAQILRGIARFWIDEGKPELAGALLDEALGICEEVGCLRGKAQVLNQFTYMYLAHDRIAQAKRAARRVLLIVRDLDDRLGEVFARYSVGLVQQREGAAEEAEATLLHALGLARRFGERFVEGAVLYALGEIDFARGEHPAAVARLRAALDVFEALDSVLWQAKALALLARTHLACGHGAFAADELRHAAGLLSSVDSKEAAHWITEVEKLKALL